MTGGLALKSGNYGERNYPHAWEQDNHNTVLPEPYVRAPDKVSPEVVNTGQLDSLLVEHRLLATFMVDDVALVSAVIFTDGNGAYRYRIGAVLPGGASLVEIGTMSVLLEKNGHEFSIAMDSIDGSVYEAGKLIDEESSGSDGVDYFSRFSEEGIAFIEQFDIQPVKENFAEGYIIGDKIAELGVDHLGIRPGDIFLSVNGYSVGEYESDYLVWLSFRTTQRASILIRGEKGDFMVHYPEDVFIRNPRSDKEK